MKFVVRLLISVLIIIFCTQIGRKLPSLSGLIAVMPLTGLIVLLWLYAENPDKQKIMVDYTAGALTGIVPSIFFFLAAYLAFKKDQPVWIAVGLSFAAWIIVAVIHQIIFQR